MTLGGQVAEVLRAAGGRARCRSTRGGTARPTAAASRCATPITTPSPVQAMASQLVGQRLLDAERVVADDLEPLRDAGEQRRVVVEDRAEAAVHRPRARGRPRRRSSAPRPWWPRQTPSSGTSAASDRVGADAEVLRGARAARARARSRCCRSRSRCQLGPATPRRCGRRSAPRRSTAASSWKRL